MTGLDRTAARALAEAGYMPLSLYLDMVRQDDHPAPSLVPEAPDDPHDPLLPEPQFAHPISMA